MIEDVKIVTVAHCILNQCTRWWNEGKELSKGMLFEVVKKISEMRIGIYQLPCPEILFLGNPRIELTKDDYNAILGFREHAKKLALKVASELEELILKSRNPKIHLSGILGLSRSPNCACYTAPLKGGMSKGGMGIFFEELIFELNKRGFSPLLFDIDLEDLKRSLVDLDKLYEEK